MGYLRANHPTVGYEQPPGPCACQAISPAVFMVSTGLQTMGGIPIT